MTERVGAMSLVDRPEPHDPQPSCVVVAPEAVGICGSDYSFFTGHMSDAAGGSQFPRVQGHEVGARIVALGDSCRPELNVGQRVALMPLTACGHCYPCSVGRPNTCDNFRLIGIHTDGGLQGLLQMPESQVHPIDVDDAALAAMAEPVSVAVRAVRRGRVGDGEHVVVLGAGPIGQCIAVVARELGAEVMLVDLQERRLELGRGIGCEGIVWTGAEPTIARVRDWAGDAGPPVAVDATGVPGAVRAIVEMVSSAGRAVQVGMSPDEVGIRIGSLTEKEIDLLGVSCCDDHDFAAAVGVVERNREQMARMVSHEFELERAPEAIRFAIDNPTEVMKVVIRGE